jgi:hypothetical protein
MASGMSLCGFCRLCINVSDVLSASVFKVEGVVYLREIGTQVSGETDEDFLFNRNKMDI